MKLKKMAEFHDNTGFISRLDNNVQENNSTMAIVLIYGIVISAGLTAYYFYLKSRMNYIFKKLEEKDQQIDQHSE